MSITRDLCIDLHNALKNIEDGKKLLLDMQKEVAEGVKRLKKEGARLSDRFDSGGIRLSIPMDRDSYSILNVAPSLAVEIIKAHIEAKEAEVEMLNQKALQMLTNPKNEDATR